MNRWLNEWLNHHFFFFSLTDRVKCVFSFNCRPVLTHSVVDFDQNSRGCVTLSDLIRWWHQHTHTQRHVSTDDSLWWLVKSDSVLIFADVFRFVIAFSSESSAASFLLFTLVFIIFERITVHSSSGSSLVRDSSDSALCYSSGDFNAIITLSLLCPFFSKATSDSFCIQRLSHCGFYISTFQRLHPSTLLFLCSWLWFTLISGGPSCVRALFYHLRLPCMTIRSFQHFLIFPRRKADNSTFKIVVLSVSIPLLTWPHKGAGRDRFASSAIC